MIASVATLTARKGHEAKVADILSDYVTKEKKVKGCIRCYFKKALNNDDTFLLYSEYDTLEHFEAANKPDKPQEPGKIRFILKPHVVKAFFGNFD